MTVQMIAPPSTWGWTDLDISCRFALQMVPSRMEQVACAVQNGSSDETRLKKQERRNRKQVMQSLCFFLRILNRNLPFIFFCFADCVHFLLVASARIFDWCPPASSSPDLLSPDERTWPSRADLQFASLLSSMVEPLGCAVQIWHSRWLRLLRLGSAGHLVQICRADDCSPPWSTTCCPPRWLAVHLSCLSCFLLEKNFLANPQKHKL